MKIPPLQRFDLVGDVTICTMLLAMAMMHCIDRQVSEKLQTASP